MRKPKGREVFKKTKNSSLDRTIEAETYNQHPSGDTDVIVDS